MARGNSPNGEPPVLELAPDPKELAGQARRADVRWAFDLYNATAKKCRLRQATKLTPGRAAAIKTRLNDFGCEGWERALANLERSAFLRGSNDRNWSADLDFMLQASSFTKLHDGRYGNGAHAPSPESEKSQQDLAAAFERARLADEEADRCRR